jgi:alkylation response protein AidB-like acyl-CoA dehydrogenase
MWQSPDTLVSPIMFQPGGALEELRNGVREWCAAHVPKEWREQQRGVSHEELVRFMEWWGGELREAGLLAPHWPKEWGGGFSVREQVVIAEELARGDAPRNGLYHVGVFNVAPTLVHSGTQEQREQYLPAIWGGEVWCQGYSEPNAGSDLAGLQTRAMRDGDNYVVNGQKVWTSWAKEADLCMLLARTDPDVPKHKGISCLIVDMHAPGVEVRPIRQAWGPADFNEVFFDDVTVPVDNLIGPENRGWAVANGTLAAERAVVILEAAERLRCNGIEAAIAEAATIRLESGEPALEDSAVRELLASCYAEVHVLRRVLNEMIEDILRGADVSGTSSIIKVLYTDLLHRFTREITALHGVASQLDRPVLACAGWETGFWMNDYIHSFGWLIGGGTNEIQRNVIGERMLGLPR